MFIIILQSLGSKENKHIKQTNLKKEKVGWWNTLRQPVNFSKHGVRAKTQVQLIIWMNFIVIICIRNDNCEDQ